MKRVLLGILALVGVGGLVALMRYHPASQASNSAVTPQATSSPAADPTDSASVDGTAAPQTAAPATPAGQYRNGTYTGPTVDVGYGPVQVQAVISGGRLTSVRLLQMPEDIHHSAEIASWAGPELVQEAITAQSASVDIVSGATQDSEGFIQSLGSALGKAKA